MFFRLLLVSKQRGDWDGEKNTRKKTFIVALSLGSLIGGECQATIFNTEVIT